MSAAEATAAARVGKRGFVEVVIVARDLVHLLKGSSIVALQGRRNAEGLLGGRLLQIGGPSNGLAFACLRRLSIGISVLAFIRSRRLGGLFALAGSLICRLKWKIMACRLRFVSRCSGIRLGVVALGLATKTFAQNPWSCWLSA